MKQVIITAFLAGVLNLSLLAQIECLPGKTFDLTGIMILSNI